MTIAEQLKQTGRMEGLIEGRMEGLQEGRLEAVREMARNMLAKGIDSETITSITGISADELAIMRH